MRRTVILPVLVLVALAAVGWLVKQIVAKERARAATRPRAFPGVRHPVAKSVPAVAMPAAIAPGALVVPLASRAK
jgi:hypothetical protein